MPSYLLRNPAANDYRGKHESKLTIWLDGRLTLYTSALKVQVVAFYSEGGLKTLLISKVIKQMKADGSAPD